MSLLTNAALNGYRQYTKRILSHAIYKLGDTPYRTRISSVAITNDGVVDISIPIEPVATGVITEVQIYDTSGTVWFSKAESMDVGSVVEGFEYSVQLSIKEKEEGIS